MLRYSFSLFVTLYLILTLWVKQIQINFVNTRKRQFLSLTNVQFRQPPHGTKDSLTSERIKWITSFFFIFWAVSRFFFLKMSLLCTANSVELTPASNQTSGQRRPHLSHWHDMTFDLQLLFPKSQQRHKCGPFPSDPESHKSSHLKCNNINIYHERGFTF